MAAPPLVHNLQLTLAQTHQVSRLLLQLADGFTVAASSGSKADRHAASLHSSAYEETDAASVASTSQADCAGVDALRGVPSEVPDPQSLSGLQGEVLHGTQRESLQASEPSRAAQPLSPTAGSINQQGPDGDADVLKKRHSSPPQASDALSPVPADKENTAPSVMGPCSGSLPGCQGSGTRQCSGHKSSLPQSSTPKTAGAGDTAGHGCQSPGAYSPDMMQAFAEAVACMRPSPSPCVSPFRKPTSTQKASRSTPGSMAASKMDMNSRRRTPSSPAPATRPTKIALNELFEQSASPSS